MKTKTKSDLELNLILIKNEINFIQIELIKHESFKAPEVQQTLRGLMSTIVTYRPDIYLNWSIIDSDPELTDNLKDLHILKDRELKQDPTDHGLKFALSRFMGDIIDLEFSLVYNDIDNENVQHYLIGLIKTIVVKDLSIFLVDLKKYNVYDYYENLIRSNIDEIELSKFLFNRDQSLYLIELAK